jgi:hypothetical protein
MRHLIKKLSEIGRVRGLASQKAQNNKRLAAAAAYGPIRPVESLYVLGIATFNPGTEQSHIIEIRHDVGNGNNRYCIYLDGVKLGKQWSRARFCGWMFNKIERVINYDE